MCVCGYVMRLAAYDFSVFEYHALTHTYPYIRISSLFIPPQNGVLGGYTVFSMSEIPRLRPSDNI